MKKGILFIPGMLMVSLLLGGCGDSEPVEGDSQGKSKPVVFAVNYPLAYFAERIGGESIEVKFLAPADEDPAFWNPGDDAVAAAQKATVILRNGADYAKWVQTVSLPTGNQVNTSSAFAEKLIKAEQGLVHSHGKSGDHDHGGMAFTTWIDLDQAVQQAAACDQCAHGSLGRPSSPM